MKVPPRGLDLAADCARIKITLMNYLAHGYQFIDDPYFLAGTAVPDWLSVVDRRVRVRSRHAEVFESSHDPNVSAVARGIVRHHADDGWFHATAAFAQLSLWLCSEFRRVLPEDHGFRPHFLGHITIELLLDAALAEDDPQLLKRYYKALDSLDPTLVEEAVNRMAPSAVQNLATFIELFLHERFLCDYEDDARLCRRLNQVMRRVGLPVLGAEVLPVLAVARQKVSQHKAMLLAA